MDDLAENPFNIFAAWLAEAETSEPNDPTAMTVATATPAGRPSARMVLLKAWDAEGFVFYTNLGSRKSEEIRGNAQAAILFHWKSLRRQIRIEGVVTPTTDAQADTYFASRPRQSQLGAWASDQSRPMPARETFESRLRAAEQEFVGRDVPRPATWSGWRVAPEYFEFWLDIRYRLHDRRVFTRRDDGWEAGRLYP